MLPDYPIVKNKFMKYYMDLMAQAHQQHLGFFGQIKSSVMHEGEADVLVREDGSVDEMEPKTLSVTSLIPAGSPDVEELNFAEIVNSMIEVGRRLADEKARMIIEKIEEATRKVGNVVGPNSDPAEQIFEMVEKRHFDFDQQGRPIWGQFVAHPETMEAIKGTLERIESTPDLKDRMERLIEKKRSEFLDREAARKLVD